MSLRIGKFFGVICAVFVISAALELNIFGETVNSNIFTAEQKDNFADFKGKSISTTANLNWQTENGEKITKTTVKNLPSYLLTVNASVQGREKATFISSPKNALDMSGIGRLYFVIQYSADDEKNEYTVNLSLGDGTDRLVCTAPLKGNLRQLVSFEIGFFSTDRNITELSLEFLSDSNGGKISVSGPYYLEHDKTYAEDFSLADVSFSPDAMYTDQGIFIADSTQKTGFSGRLWRPSQSKVSHLRLFISTGVVGGTLEIRYSYFNRSSGALATKSAYVTLKDRADNYSYLVPFENADSIISLSFLFDVAREGGVTVHRVETAELYLQNNKDIFGEISRCTYSANGGTVTIKGKIFHDFLIKHHDFSLYCYRLDGGETLEDVVSSGKKPIASSKMSSEFKMMYKAGRQDKLAVLSRYVLVASDGDELVRILPPFHVEKESPKIPADNSRIKGICLNSPLGASGMGAGVCVVDVQLDRLLGQKKSGYIYSVGSTNFYFDSDYVHSIDDHVKKLCVAGCSVYLRLMADGGLYDAISVEDAESMTRLFSVVDFLTSRYSDHKYGSIKGYVIGKSMNLYKTYGDEPCSLSDLSKKLADSMEVIALSASVSMSDARIILPVSGDESIGTGYDRELFLQSLCNRLDELGGLTFTVMLESSKVYFSTNVATAGSVEFDRHVSDIGKMLSRLAQNSASADDSYVYFWNPEPSETDERLKPAYVYMYYRLLMSDACDSFVLSSNRSLDSDLWQLVKYIDTQKNENGELSDFVLDLLGVTDWSEVIPEYDRSKIPVRLFSETEDTEEIAEKGRFALFDFSSSVGTLGWFAGDGCPGISMISDSEGKFLLATMESYDGESELLYHFDRPEKLSMAPYLCFDFSVGQTENEKYLLCVTVRSGRDTLEACSIFSGGEKNSFVVDVGNIARKAPIDSISIRVSAVERGVDNYGFKLYGVSALSKTLDDKALETAVHQARADAGHHSGLPSDDETKTPDYEFIIALVAVLVVCVIVAGIYDRNKER